MSFRHCIHTSTIKRCTAPDKAKTMKDLACAINRKLIDFFITALTCGIIWFCIGLWVYLALGSKPL